METQQTIDKIFTLDEVKQHNTIQDCYIIVDGFVYDVTKFISLHPGGKKVILDVAGQDASNLFVQFHSWDVLPKYQKLIVGRLAEIPQKKFPLFEISDFACKGTGIPYAESWDALGGYSPYYDQSHKDLRRAIRKFVEKEVKPYAFDLEENGNAPQSLYKKVCEQGLMTLAMGTPWPDKYVPDKTVCGVKLQNPDSFHELILHEEFTRGVNSGIASFIYAGNSIGLPPIIKFSSPYLQDKIISPVLRGDKRIVLAITEPHAGSDVAQIKTIAEKTSCGKYYIVSGMKKWITNGIFSDYFTTAVVTDPEQGMFGISLLLIERTMPGVLLRKMKCQAIWASGTTFIIFDKVKVPVENLIGDENEGFKLIMLNFNHERLCITMTSQGLQKYALELILQYVGLIKININIHFILNPSYVHNRKTFGKRLIDHTVIRMKLGKMMSRSFQVQALLEQCCYNYDRMKMKSKLQILPSTLSLLKASIGNIGEQNGFDSLQILGGVGYTRSGIGKEIELCFREAKAGVILGGSEEIMLDLGVKMASRLMPQL